MSKLTDNIEKLKVFKSRYLICPECGNFLIYSEREIHCIVCSEKLLSECPNCKEPIIYPTSRYCPICGQSLRNKESKLQKQC